MSAVKKRDLFLLNLRGLLASLPIAFLLLAILSRQNNFVINNGQIIAIISSVIIIVAFMPLIYNRINSTVIVFSGRYHLVLAICSIIAPVAFVGAFLAGNSDTAWLNAIICGFLLFISIIAALVLLSATNSIARRMTDVSDRNKHDAFSFLATIAATAIILATYFAVDNFSDYNPIMLTVYAASILMLLGGTAVYFGSANHMPRFIRLEPPTKRKLKEVYSQFYSPFFKRNKSASTISIFFLLVVVFVGAFNVFDAVILFEISSEFFIFGMTAFFVSLFVGLFITDKFISSDNRFYVKLIAALFLLNVLAFSTIRYFVPFGVLDNAIFIACFVLIGLSGGSAFAIIKLNKMEAIMQIEGLKEGIINTFYLLLIYISAFLAIAFINIGYVFGVVIINSFILIWLVVFIVQSSFEKKDSGLTLNVLDYITETRIAEDIKGEASVTISNLDSIE